MPILRTTRSARALIRRVATFAAISGVSLASGSCINDAPVSPPTTSSLSVVAASGSAPVQPNALGLTHARLLLRPIGFYGDSAVIIGDWVADSAVFTLPVSVVGTSQLFDLFVTATNARGDTLLRGHTRIRLFSVFTISTRLALDYVGPDANLTTLRIAPRDTIIAGGGTFAMRATGTDATGAPVTPIIVDWTSRNPALFTVNASGQVTAGSIPGVAYIVATSANGKKDSTTITVRTGITSTVVTPQRDSLGAFGESHQLAAQAFSGPTPVAGTFTWVSRNPSLVTVTPNGGLITAVANGTTYVVATEAGGTKDSALVIVKQRINRITVAPPTASIIVGATQPFVASAFDSNNNPIVLSAGNVTWSSANTTVATIDPASGVATGRAVGGPITITATAAIGGATGTAQLTVITNVTRVAITPSPISFASFGQTTAVTATAYDAANNPVTVTTFNWSIGNTAVATIASPTGLTNTVTAVGNGTTTLTASVAGVTSPAVTVTVQQAIARIALAPPSASVVVNGTQQFVVSAFDANNNPIADLTPFTCAWTSSVDAIATVSFTGLATGHAVGGPVTIRVSCSGFAATAQLTVVSNIASVTIAPSPLVFDRIGQAIVVTATARDAGGTIVSAASYSWSIGNSSVASITGSTTNTNTVTSVDNGSTTLTVTADGVSSAPVTVTVAQVPTSIEIKSLTNPPVVAPGGKLQMVARGKDANGVYLRTPFTVDAWFSSDPSDLPIDANGVVTGNQPEFRGSRSSGGSAAASSFNPTSNITAIKGAITSNTVVVTEDFGAPAKKIQWDRDTLFTTTGASITVHLYGTVPVAHPLTLHYATPNGAVVTVPPANVVYGIGVTDFTVTLQGGAAGTTTVTVTDTGAEFTGSTMTVVVRPAGALGSVGSRRRP